MCACAAAAAAGTLLAGDSLVTNGDFETDNNSDQWPDDWKQPKEGCTWGEEGGNHFLRLEADVPDRMTMLYREIAIPPGAQSLELKFRARVTGLKTGTSAWFDARFMAEFLDASRQPLKPTPAAPYFRTDTGDWVEKSLQLTVPEGAKTLKLMPCLFKVGTGTLEIDDISVTVAGDTAFRGGEKNLTAHVATPASSAPKILFGSGFSTGGWPARNGFLRMAGR